MRILGVDPGLGATGYGLVEWKAGRAVLLEAGVIRGLSRAPTQDRLKALYDSLSEVIDEHAPDVMATEDLYSKYGRPQTAILMGHARGVIFLAAADRGMPVFSYRPTRIKKALTGNGRATKAQVQRMVQVRLELNRIPEPEDVADALAVALCHCQSLRVISS